MARAARAAPPRASLSGVPAAAASLKGLRAAGLAFGLGAVAAFGQAPFHLWPLTALALTVFVWQLDGAHDLPRRRMAAMWRGWWLGFGYFLSGLWWIGSAFLVEPERYAALLPFAIAAFPAGLALLWGIVGMVAISFWRRDWRRIVLLATVFLIVEYARGHILTGFPWNLMGQVWPAGGAISQSASVFGVWGLTGLTLFAFMAPAALAGPDRRASDRMAPVVIAVSMFVALFATGHVRLMLAQERETDVRLRIVQARIDQAEKWRPENRDAVRDHYLNLTAQDGIETRTHVVWAESALPVRLLDEPRILDSIARTLGDGRVLLTGLVRRDVSDPLRPRFFNSFAAISVEQGTPVVAAIYDKVKLVPFGEYTPLAGALERIAPEALITFSDGYTHGPTNMTVDVPGAPPLAPQICYEVIFPGFTPRGAERPGWIVNVTNDSWYEGTPGPHQLFNQARFRAIEEGVPLARAASGGFSALVDPYGRSAAQLATDADGVVDVDLPAALRPPIYAVVGDAPVFVMLGVGLFFGLTRRRKPARRR